MALPFVVLLAAIALAPLFFATWWGASFRQTNSGAGSHQL